MASSFPTVFSSLQTTFSSAPHRIFILKNLNLFTAFDFLAGDAYMEPANEDERAESKHFLHAGWHRWKNTGQSLSLHAC